MQRSLSVLALSLGALLGLTVPLRAQEARVAASVAAQGPPRQAAPADSTQHHLGEQGLAIEGWDPVAYFPEGGGKPAQGAAADEVVLNGARYRFANAEHARLFSANPGRYVPAYGGWCAYAMAKGEKVEVDPESFLVQDGRLMLFYKSFFNDTRDSWLEDASLLPKADANWMRLSGEGVRGDSAAAAGTESTSGSKAGTAGGAEPGLAATGPAVGYEVGQRAPAFTLKDKAGAEHSLADYRGKLVVLDFWATWCGPCKAAMPGVQKLHESFKDKGVVVIGVNGFERDPAADPVGYMAGKGYTYQLLLGGEALKDAYALEGLPTFVIIDEDGIVLAREVGQPKDETLLPALIGKHLSARAGG